MTWKCECLFSSFYETGLFATVTWKQRIISKKDSEQTNTYFKSTIRTTDLPCFYVCLYFQPNPTVCASFGFVVVVVIVVVVVLFVEFG